MYRVLATRPGSFEVPIRCQCVKFSPVDRHTPALAKLDVRIRVGLLLVSPPPHVLGIFRRHLDQVTFPACLYSLVICFVIVLSISPGSITSFVVFCGSENHRTIPPSPRGDLLAHSPHMPPFSSRLQIEGPDSLGRVFLPSLAGPTASPLCLFSSAWRIFP